MRTACSAAALLVAAACSDSPGGTMSTTPLWTIEGVNECGSFSAAAGDFDGDGRLDLAVLAPDCTWNFEDPPAPSRLRLYRGEAAELAAEIEIEDDYGGFAIRLIAADVDGDGRDDLVVDGSTSQRLFRGDDSLEAMLAAGLPAPFGLRFAADTVPGGGVELIGLNGSVQIHSWDGEGLTFEWLVSAHAVGPAGDVDGDGLLDLLVRSDDAVALHRGCRVGAGCVHGVAQAGEPVELSGVPFAAGDVDGDGDGDLVGYSESGRFELYRSEQGRPGPAGWSIVPDPVDGGFDQVAGGDVDGDGDRDLLVAAGRRILMFRGGGDGLEAEPSWQWSGAGALRAVVVRDLDGDGDADLVAAEHGDDGPRLIAYPGGRVPADAPRPYLPAELACPLHDGDRPDLTTDADLIARTVAVRWDDFAADSCEVAEQCVAAAGRRKLLEFSVAVQNFGGAAAELPSAAVAPELYVYDGCHRHDHLVGFAEYELLDGSGEVVLAGRKQGYYLIDVIAYCDRAAGPESFDHLLVSRGWADIYFAGLPCQWIDVTDLPDGDYQLRVEVNASGVFEEDDRLPNQVVVPIRIEGDAAAAR